MDESKRLRREFYRWFARTDLSDAKAKRTTRAVVGTLVVVQTLTLLMMGLTHGYALAQQRQYEEDPLSLCVFAGSRIRPDLFPEETERALTTELNARAPSAKLFPVERIRFNFGVLPEDEYDVDPRVQFKGRTLRDDDPILSSYDHEGIAGQFGVLITPAFMDDYGDETPSELTFYHAQRNVQKTVPVLGVLKSDLAEGFKFVVTEETYNTLRSLRLTTRFKSGPVASEAHEYNRWNAEQLKLFRDVLNDYQLGASPLSEGGFDFITGEESPRYWVFSSANDDGIEPGKIPEVLAELHTKLSAVGIELGEEFANGTDESGSETSSPITYDLAEIIASRAADLPDIARSLDEVGLKYDRDILDQLISVTNVTAVLSALLLLVALLVILSAGYNIFTILSQLAEFKASEIAMMKALGFGNGQLIRLNLTAGFMLWRSSLVIAVLLTLSIGYASQWAINYFAGQTLIVFSVQLWVACLTFSLALIVTLMSTVLATKKIRQRSPAQTLAVAR